MGASFSGKNHFVLILATLSGLSSLPQCLGKDLFLGDGPIRGVLVYVPL